MNIKKKAPERLKWLGAFALGVGFLGFAILVLALVTVWRTGWGISLFIPGATLITVALSSYVAGRGLVSWREQRKRDRESVEYRHREHVYEQMGVYMLTRFQGVPTDSAKEAELRMGAALWGSKEILTHLVRYQDMISRLLEDSPGGTVSLSHDEQVEMKGIIGDVVQAMRGDLQPFTGQEEVSNQVLINSLFNREKDKVAASGNSQG